MVFKDFLIFLVNNGKLKNVNVNVFDKIEKLYLICIMKIKKLNSLIIMEGNEFKILIEVWIKLVN